MNKKYIYFFTKLFFVVLFACLFISCGTMESVVIKPNYDFKQIKRVAVLDFSDISYYRNAGPMAAQLFIKYLLKTGYDVIERNELDAIMREHNLSLSGVLNREQIIEVGKLSGVDAIVTGSVTLAVPERVSYESDGYVRYISAQAGVTCRMFSVETGEILWAASNTYDAMDVPTAFEYLVSSLIRDFMKSLKQSQKQS